MSIFTRLLNQLRPRRLERDVKDEVDFHLDMRAARHVNNGMSARDATTQAREQFGDVDAVMRGMRRARLAPLAVPLSMALLATALAVAWIGLAVTGGSAVRLPDVPAAPMAWDEMRPSDAPPPPPPHPTWEEFVAKVNTFGGAADGKANRR